MAAQPSQSQREFKQFADNLRKTAVGVKFAKILFTEPDSLSPKQITKVLKTLGLPIPAEVQMTADVAQVIISGQAISQGLAAGKSLKDLGNQTNLAGESFKSLTNFAESNNWVDADAASVIRISTDVAMIVASGGTNVQAYIALASDLSQAVGAKQGLADYRAIVNAQNMYKNRVSPQAAILGSTFKDFQEKRISIFGVIAKMAVETPDLWPQVVTPDSPFVSAFPDLMMLPVVGASVTGEGTAEISGSWPWPSRGRYVIARWNSYKTIEFSTLGTQFNKEIAAEYFFELLLRPWVACYAIANSEIVGRGNMSMANIAALSYMINPNGQISDRDDYVGMLIGSMLTPYDFGDNILDNIANEFVETAYAGEAKNFKESAVSVGLNPKNMTFNSYQKDKEIMRQKLQQVKDSEDIVELVQYPYIYKKLQSYMDFEETSFEKDPTLGGRLNAKFPENSVRAWRELHNYLAVLQLLDTFRKDSYLKETRFAAQLMPFMPSVDDFEQNVSRLNYISTMRSVNRVALANIAQFLDVPQEKLVKITDKYYLGAAKFTIK